MGLKIEDIFEILDEVDNASKKRTLLKEQSPDTSEKASGAKIGSKKMQITLPRIFISEDWGKTGTPDRGVLEKIVDRAAAGQEGKHPLRKLANINNYLDQIVGGLGKDKRISISKLISSIIVFETMMKMFNSFSISSSGFLNEAFMSVFYGKKAYQVPPKSAMGIEDIIVTTPNTYISLKTLEKTRTDLEGSLKLLQKTLNDDKFGNKIFYHVFIKDTNTNQIQNLRMFEIPIYRSSIPVFYEDSIDSSKHFMGLVYTMPRPSESDVITNLLKNPVPIVTEDDEKEEKGNDDEESLSTAPSAVPSSDDTQPGIKPLTKPKSKNNKTVTPPSNKKISPDPSEIDYLKLQLKTLQLRKKGETRDTSEFRIPVSVWSKFVSPSFPKEGLFLDLSETKYRKIITQAADILNEELAELFTNLDNFSKNITQFFVSDDMKSGIEAYRNAQDLEQKTATIVKSYGE